MNDIVLHEKELNLASKILVVDDDIQYEERLKQYFAEKNLIGLKAKPGELFNVLDSNMDLGAVMIAWTFSLGDVSAEDVIVKIHQCRPELPIFVHAKDIKAVSASVLARDFVFFADDMEQLDALIDSNLFSRFYPMGLVCAVQDVAKSVFTSIIDNVDIDCYTPCLVRDKLIYGDIFSLMPLESSWYRGFMLLQTTRHEMAELIRLGKTYINPAKTNFIHINDVINEMTNLIWGGVKTRFQYDDRDSSMLRTDVPIIVNYSERYISFGTNEPQLCFGYELTSKEFDFSMTVFQNMIFNMEWRPEDFEKNPTSVSPGTIEFF